MYVCMYVSLYAWLYVWLAMSDRSSDSSDCHMVKVQNPKSSSTGYNVKIETSPEPDLRNSSSTLQDEELTGSYTVSSSPRNDFNVRRLHNWFTSPFYC